MGKMKNHVYGWLEDYGFALGYDMSNAPNFEDMDWVADDNINAKAYWENKKNKEKQQWEEQ